MRSWKISWGMWWDALHLIVIFMSRCPSFFIIFCGKFFFINPQRKKNSLKVEKEIFFTKINEGWKISTHKNDHEMENISSHASTYFPTSHTNQVISFSFLYCYQTELKRWNLYHTFCSLVICTLSTMDCNL